MANTVKLQVHIVAKRFFIQRYAKQNIQKLCGWAWLFIVGASRTVQDV